MLPPPACCRGGLPGFALLGGRARQFARVRVSCCSLPGTIEIQPLEPGVAVTFRRSQRPLGIACFAALAAWWAVFVLVFGPGRLGLDIAGLLSLLAFLGLFRSPAWGRRLVVTAAAWPTALCAASEPHWEPTAILGGTLLLTLWYFYFKRSVVQYYESLESPVAERRSAAAVTAQPSLRWSWFCLAACTVGFASFLTYVVTVADSWSMARFPAERLCDVPTHYHWIQGALVVALLTLPTVLSTRRFERALTSTDVLLVGVAIGAASVFHLIPPGFHACIPPSLDAVSIPYLVIAVALYRFARTFTWRVPPTGRVAVSVRG